MSYKPIDLPAASRPRWSRGLAGLLTPAILAITSPALGAWEIQSPRPTHLDVRGVAAPTPGHLFVATDDDFFDSGGSLFESTDGGITWVQRDIPASLASALDGLFFLDGANGWTWGNENYRTTDGGATWTALPFLGSTYFMEFSTADFGVATGNFGQAVSLDGGLTWSPAPDGMFRFDFANATTGLGVSGTGIRRTTDGGATFTPVLAGGADAVTFLSGTVAVGIVDDAFVRSTDAGITWTAGSSAAGRTELVAASSDVVLAWGRTGVYPSYDDRVLRSSDGGATWTDLGEVLDPPAGAATTFAFALPQPARVQLAVYDVAGRLVTHLVDETRPAGRYEATWDARGMASGAYFVRMTAGTFTRTQRVLLVR